MIIRGGENIYPKEIENAFYTHQDVLEAAVVGSRTRSSAKCRSRSSRSAPVRRCPLPGARRAPRRDPRRPSGRPARIELVDEIPKNTVGKIDKPALRLRVAETARPVR